MEVRGVKKRKTLLSFYKPQEPASTSKENRQSNYDSSNPDEQRPSRSQNVGINVSPLERDPGIRIPISQYPVNERDEIRRAYIRLGPYQPILPEYPPTQAGAQNRRFQSSRLKQFSWLEYSPSKNAAFCFPCYIFENNSDCYRSFTINGFTSWKRINGGARCAFVKHVGGNNSPHSNAVSSIDALMNVSRHIDQVINVQELSEKQKNRLRLKTTIESIRWLTFQGCAFRGHDESPSSKNRGNLIELIKLLGRMSTTIDDIVLENAPGNAKYVAPLIQKNILQIIAGRVRTKIRKEIGDAKFCILVDEAKDISSKEQMAIVLRFVDVVGFLRERFFEIVHVADTSAIALKEEISKVLVRHNLEISDMRGQGYDGASNMSGSWNVLQALFLRDSPYAYHIHCFAHRLQLALVGAAEKEMSIWLFFSKLTSIVNLIGASSKRNSELHSAQVDEIANMIAIGERTTGIGTNQVGTLHRARKTRWSSHFESICSLIDMYGAVIKVLEIRMDERSTNSIRGEACGCYTVMKSYDFVFNLYFMHKVMGITDLLCQALETKSIDILNAMDLVSSTKALFGKLRSQGFASVLLIVERACENYDIEIPNMSDYYKAVRGRQQKDQVAIEHHYHFDVYHATIDFQMAELNNIFNDGAVEILKLSFALDPKESFKLFNVDRICSLGEKFYPGDFTEQEMHYLRCQLGHYEVDVLRHEGFQNVSTISELCQKLAETKKAQDYRLVDMLIRLVLTLPVSTATTERAFSAMKQVKTVLRNKMEDEFLSNPMVVYIERELAEDIDIDSMIDEFYSMKHRRAQL